jgi:ABC-type branched-subunit amino acid transport system substrate-binding protein
MARLRAFTALDLTGSLRLQSEDARRGLELWSDDDGIDLEVVDLGASPESAYQERVGEDILLGPYGSGLVRKVLRAVDGSAVMWNHGGSADDLARPWAPMVAAPASGYFTPLVDLAVARGCERVTIVQGGGRFADFVTRGAVQHAERASLPVDTVSMAAWESSSFEPDGALLVAGLFEEDVAVVRSSTARLVGCVAAGIPAFLAAAGSAAEGVLGPVQWLVTSEQPAAGPSGAVFVARYRERFAGTPSYVAAQAAAAGYLAASAKRDRRTSGDLGDWSISTMLGEFRVDVSGRQIGHRVSVVQWREGRMQPVG